MARSFHQSLLAAVAAVVVSGLASAQTELQEAVRLLRLGQNEEAKIQLRQVLAAEPSNTEALQLYQSVSQDEWYLLMTSQGEIEQIAKSLLDRAKATRRERSRDEDTIRSLVATATSQESNYGERQAAINALVMNHGEFAVPALAEKLGNQDDAEGQILAISALTRLNVVAVLPLIELLKSPNDVLVQNAASALLLIGDDRATPFMAQLATDERVAISGIANKFLAKAKQPAGQALSLMLSQSLGYLKGNIPFGGYSEVVWSFDGEKGGLVATDVPALLYPTELAKAVASDAVRANPQSLEARSMLAQANLAEASLIETSIADGNEAVAELGPVAVELKNAAMATGVDALRRALSDGIKEGLAPVAVGAIHALAKAELADSIDSSSLVAALDSSDKAVQYAAAQALVVASRGSNVPNERRVVEVLAQAVTEEQVHRIQVIDPSIETRAAVETSNKVRGYWVDAASTAIDGMHSLLINPSVDVVVINETLPDGLPRDIIGNIRKDPRMSNVRIVIVTGDEDAAKERFGDDIATILAPVDQNKLLDKVREVLEGSSTPANVRAEAVASIASEALRELADRKAQIGGALDSLAAQMNRGDNVSVPAAKALGLSGSEAHLAPLTAALAGGSDALKVAAAQAMGNILGRLPSCPAEVTDALFAALDGAGEGDLRNAVAIALGKAKLDGEKRLMLLRKVGRVAGGAAGEG